MGYEVHKFKNAVGDVWYQVGKRSWLFWIKWDEDWPWSTSIHQLPNRFDTVDEAYDRVDELVLRDKLETTRRLGPVGRPAPTDNLLTEIERTSNSVVYAVASLPQEPPTVTETKQAKRPARKRKRKE